MDEVGEEDEDSEEVDEVGEEDEDSEEDEDESAGEEEDRAGRAGLGLKELW